MPRPPRPWYRSYSEELDNGKVFALGNARPDLYFAWRLLLDLANISTPRGYLPADVSDIAFALRQSPQKTAEILSDLQRFKFIDLKGKRLYMHKWHDWNPDSDANLTKARAGRNERTPKERVKNGERTGNGTSGDAGSVLKERTDKEEEKDKEQEIDKEADAEDARPPEYPFAFMYAQKYRSREGRPLPPQVHAACLALEREFGSQPCIDAASDYDWQKHPNYLKPGLEERRDGKQRVQKTGQPTGRGAASGAAAGDFGLDDWHEYARGDQRSPATATT